MNFGVPREKHGRYQEERRVGLSPAGVTELVRAGATVFIESKAGVDTGFTNHDYRFTFQFQMCPQGYPEGVLMR